MPGFEKDNPDKNVDALFIETTGRDDETRIAFSVTKHKLGTPNTSTIRVWNLSEQSRSRIRQGHAAVELWAAGELIARGGVLSAISTRDGAEIITEISLLDGFNGMTLGVYRRTLAKNYPLNKLVREIAKTMPGITVEQSRVTITGGLGYKGATMSGRAADLLDGLADQFGFSWSVQDGHFQAIPDDKHLEKNTDVGSLIYATPLLSGVGQIETGVEFQTTLLPGVLPGEKVTIKPTVMQSLAGTYDAHLITHDGDSHADQWTTTVQSMKQL